jgi:hypothetical protein
MIIMDADPPGRAAAQRIAHDLTPHAETTTIDLAPDRNDGYDLTDWILAEVRGNTSLSHRLLAFTHALEGEGHGKYA